MSVKGKNALQRSTFAKKTALGRAASKSAYVSQGRSYLNSGGAVISSIAAGGLMAHGNFIAGGAMAMVAGAQFRWAD